MKGKTAGFLTLVCVGIAAAVYYAGIVQGESGQVQEENSTQREQFAESSEVKAPSADTEGTDTPDKAEEKAESFELSDSQEKTQEEAEDTEDTEEAQETRENIQEGTKRQEQKDSESEEKERSQKKESVKMPEEALGELPKEVPEETNDVREKNRTDHVPVDIGIRKTYSSSDIPPEDTVPFIPSRKEEIVEDRYVESVVDENDPNSYQIVKKEERIPTLYVNNVGDIKYAYEDGIWYEYRYSNVNITLDTKNEDLALLILNIDGFYDEYEVVRTDCKEVKKENGSTEYEFHVRYQGAFAMEGSHSEVAHLTASDIGMVAATRTVVTEVKVPVLMQESVGTGEYCYYGWQVLDEGTFYFDQNGNKVTGSQVIQGIRHEFDENGVRTSHAGVEVSEDNGEIDWKRAADAGLDFAVIQCAYRDAGGGRIVTDSRAEENIRGAQEAGLEVFLSLFSQAVNGQEAVEEAETVINMAERFGIKTPVAVTGAYANPEHSGRADGLKPSERTACMNAFCRTVKEKGYTPILHAETGFIRECLIMEELMENPLWVAEYSTNLTYTGPYQFWQYTARGSVDGISGYTGLIISYENRRDFQ